MERRPQIAIVGSVDGTRQFDPPLLEPELAGKAATQLGAALADRGWDIIVFSAASAFVEADFVRGYAASERAAPRSIHVHTPSGKGDFPELRTHEALFDPRPDASTDWEVSFYRSLAACDAVLVIGGGRSTNVTGLVALAMDKPVVAVATFGGNAHKVWEHLHRQRRGIGDDDLAEMARDWRAESATRLVDGLDRQLSARRATSDERARLHRLASWRARAGLLSAAGLLVLAVLGLAVSRQLPVDSFWTIAVLALSPALAASGGALVGNSLDAQADGLRAAILGGAAGLITGLLYVTSQLLGTSDLLNPDNPEGVSRLLLFALPLGFVAGLTFDAVYRRLRRADVSQAGQFGS